MKQMGIIKFWRDPNFSFSTDKFVLLVPIFSHSQTSISDHKLSTNEDVTSEDRKLAALALTTTTDEGVSI